MVCVCKFFAYSTDYVVPVMHGIYPMAETELYT
jgi:hypothetical protein